MRDLIDTTVTATGHDDTTFHFDPWDTIPSGHETAAFVGDEQVGVVRRYEVVRAERPVQIVWEFQAEKNLAVYSGSQLNHALRDWIKDHD